MSYAAIATYAPSQRETTARRPSPATFLDEEALESLYLALGDIEGPLAGPSGRAKLRERMREHGHQGIMWLIARLEGERSQDTLNAAAALLAHLLDRQTWPALLRVLRPLLSEEQDSRRAYVEALLRALADSRLPKGHEADAAECVQMTARSRDAIARELGLRLAACLPEPLPALALFEGDPDPEVRATLEELRDELRAG